MLGVPSVARVGDAQLNRSCCHREQARARRASGYSRVRPGVSGIHGSQVGAELASAEWDIKTVVVGDLLRKEIRKGTALGERADQVMKAGCVTRRYL